MQPRKTEENWLCSYVFFHIKLSKVSAEMRSLVKHMLITITISTVDVFKNFKLLSCVRVTLERVKKYLMSTVFLKMEPILFPLTT